MPPLTKHAETPKAQGELSPNNFHPLFSVSASGKFSLEYTTLPATLINSTDRKWDQPVVILLHYLSKAATAGLSEQQDETNLQY